MVGHFIVCGDDALGIRIVDESAPPVRLHPRRDTKLIAGDTAYLVGPYRELLDTLGKGQAQGART
jgi:hypothetical protein